MPPLLFSNGALLAGLGALLVPVLIHLLLKRKKQRLRFSTLQFLIQQEEKSTRRKLHHWVLLALRLLLFALLVLAFARPYLPAAFSFLKSPSKQIVFVLDASASMQAIGHGGSHWERAKQMIRERLQKLGSEDHVALVRCSTQTEVLFPFSPSEQMKAMLGGLKPDFGSADLSDGLRQAVQLLAATPGQGASICLVSDLQRSACQKISASPIPQGIDLETLSVNDAELSNLAVSDVASDSTSLQMAVVNFSDEETSGVKLNVSVDGKPALSETIDLAAGASTNWSMPLPRLSEGWHSLEARLPASDGLALDNVRYQTIYLPTAVRIVCVEPRSTKRTFEESTFFLTSALSPGTNQSSGFIVEKIAADLLTQKLSDPQEKRFQLIVIPALAQIPTGWEKALADFVNQGGSLFFFLGEEVSAHRYNSTFRDLLPVALTQVEGDIERPEQFWHLQEFDRGSEVFAAFRQPNSGDLFLPEFKRRLHFRTVNGSQILARFDDGMPLLIERKVGQGRVALVNTSADTSWTDWPKRKTFVPWLHGLARHLTGSVGGNQMQAPPQFITGEMADLELGSGLASREYRLHSPTGAEITTASDAKGNVKLDLETPGIYSLRDRRGEEVQRLAVNVPSQESDLLAMSTGEFRQKIVRTTDAPEARASIFSPNSSERPLWRALLIAGMVLLVLEVVLANRTFA